MNKIKYILLTALVASSLYSCTEDKGNYRYEETVTARINAIPEGIVMEQFEDYKLELEISYTHQGYSYDDFNYVWFAYPYNLGVSGNVDQIDTLSTERILNTQINLSAGSYMLNFRVADKKTGVYSTVSEQVTVVNGSSSGHVILCDVDSEAEVNFINSKGIVKRKVFEGVNGKKAGRNPLGLDFSQNMTLGTTRILYVRCEDENGGSMISPVDFSESSPLKNLFVIKPKKMSPTRIDAVGIKSMELLINEGMMYVRDDVKNIYSEYWEPIYGDYYLSPFTFSNNYLSTVIYDQKNRKFIRFASLANGPGSILTAPIEVAADAVFNPNSLGMDMLEGYLCGMSLFPTDGRAVAKDDDNRYYLLSFSFMSGIMTPQGKYDITAHPNVTEAGTFAFSSDGTFAYYAEGNRIHYSSFLTGNHINTYDKLIPSGHTIKKLYIDVYFKTTELCVITDDGSGSSESGSMFVFDIGADGVLTARTQYLNCFGKFVDIVYIE